MKYLLCVAIVFLTLSINSYSRNYEAVMNGGIEQVSPDGVEYCGFDNLRVEHAEGKVYCEGQGKFSCEYHDNLPDLLLNKLIGHAAMSKINGVLSGNYNLNIIENGTMYYGYVAWSTNPTTNETVANITVNP